MRILIVTIFLFNFAVFAEEPIRHFVYQDPFNPPPSLSKSKMINRDLKIIDFDAKKCSPILDEKKASIKSISCPAVAILEKGSIIVPTGKQATFTLKSNSHFYAAASIFIANEIVFTNSKNEPVVGYIFESIDSL
ncbi:MAG: hypothetical protein JWQ35_2687 [Bacteriovoracaceae bacterium]|nr:hypothetical protein [Bacteriovoracaceae bacterium]